MKKQVALIGVSGFGKTHLLRLTALAESGRIDLAAAVVVNPNETAEQLETLKKFQTRIYPDTETFFRSEAGKIDLVCIPTGINSHEVLTAAALQAKMNVLVEKPASGSVASVKRMIAAEKASEQFVAVGFQHVHAPEIQFIKRLLISGQLGKVKELSALVCWPRKDDYYQRNSWAAKHTVNGMQILDSPVNNACAHYLNILLFLCGTTLNSSAAPCSVSGQVMRARKGIEMFDGCDVDFTLDNGAAAHIMFAHCCKEQINPKLKIVCENAVIRWDTFKWSITGSDGTVTASGNVVNPGETMFSLVIDKLSRPDIPVCTLENALAHTQCVEMLESSCEIANVDAVYENGLYCVPGLETRFLNKFNS